MLKTFVSINLSRLNYEGSLFLKPQNTHDRCAVEEVVNELGRCSFFYLTVVERMCFSLPSLYFVNGSTLCTRFEKNPPPPRLLSIVLLDHAWLLKKLLRRGRDVVGSRLSRKNRDGNYDKESRNRIVSCGGLIFFFSGGVEWRKRKLTDQFYQLNRVFYARIFNWYGYTRRRCVINARKGTVAPRKLYLYYLENKVGALRACSGMEKEFNKEGTLKPIRLTLM